MPTLPVPAPPPTPPAVPAAGGFPFATHLSLEPLIAWWQAQEAAADPGLAQLAREVGRQVAAAPGCRGPLTDGSALAGYAELLPTLMRAVFAPAAATLNGAVVPFRRQCFYATPRFAEVLLGKDDQTLKQPLNVDAAGLEVQLTQRAYLLILEREYGVAVPDAGAVIFTVPDYATGLYRHYGLRFDATFVRVQVLGPKPVLTPDQVQTLLRQRHHPDQWRALLPPASFAFEGFSLLHLVDVTHQEILSQLKYDLLERDVLQGAARLEQLQEKLRVLFARPTLQVGLAAYDPHQRTFGADFGPRLHAGLLAQLGPGREGPAGFGRLLRRLLTERRPLVLPDVAAAELPADLRAELPALGVRALVLAALPYGPDTVGLVELSSPEAGSLDEFAAELLEPLLPLFAVAVRRHADEQEARVQAIIREEFTAIHPVLEWRFVAAARRLLSRQAAGQASAEIEPILFADVYPLHGVCDIRGSSAARNEAVGQDLLTQLALAAAALDAATVVRPEERPALEQLRQRLAQHQHRLAQQGLLSGDELGLYEFLRTEVEPLLAGLSAPAVAAYWAQLDPHRGILYERRRDFEASVTQLNDGLADYLDAAEAQVQAQFPHYFQRFKTDGVEFTLYVGASLVPDHTLDPAALPTLRRWQLRVLAGLARRAHALQATLPVPLETTQLLLIQAQPLSIRFRSDERQFDVDGAYNVRYEIIKKRIDKAIVLGSGERLTQPGRLALVYSQPREATEYRAYLAELPDLFDPDVEELELDELPGVRGLRALRVKVVGVRA